MKIFNKLHLRTKLIAGFVLLALLAGGITILAPRFALEKIREDAVPTLETVGQAALLGRTLQAEILEFIAAGEEETLEEINDTIQAINPLLEQIEDDLLDDPEEVEDFENFSNLVKRIQNLGPEIVQSHGQTLEALEALEELEHEAEIVLAEGSSTFDAELQAHLETGNLSELAEHSIPEQQQLAEVGRLLRVLQFEALEFITFGEVGTQAEVNEALVDMDVALRALAKSDSEHPIVISQLNDIATQLEPIIQTIFEAHTQTQSLLEVLETAEQDLNTAIETTRLVIKEDVGRGVADANRNAFILAGVLVGGSLLFGLALTRIIRNPILQLTKTVQQFGEENLSVRAEVEAQDEIGKLALGFNQLSERLQQSFVQTKQQSEQRIAELGIVSVIGQNLMTILHLDQLLPQVVDTVVERLDYYHAHIYLFDEKGENLVVAAGTGEAGQQMLAQDHHIPFNAEASFVARAARSGEVVRVGDVHRVQDWLSNELLPATRSEIAVPIILEEQVVGVLDVQQDKVDGFDEGDENLLRSLANQVAVAIRNARLFEEVETTLHRTRDLQRQYVEQGWDRKRVARRGRGQVHFSLGEADALDEALVTAAREKARTQSEVQLVPVNGQDFSISSEQLEDNGSREVEVPHSKMRVEQTLVSPIMLQGVPIGDLQLHGVKANREWSKGELALIEAVIDQVAQTAENLRLVEDVQERAGRERLINDISAKLRGATDMESLLKIGTSELTHALNPARTFVQVGKSARAETESEVADSPAGPDTNGAIL